MLWSHEYLKTCSTLAFHFKLSMEMPSKAFPKVVLYLFSIYLIRSSWDLELLWVTAGDNPPPQKKPVSALFWKTSRFNPWLLNFSFPALSYENLHFFILGSWCPQWNLCYSLVYNIRNSNTRCSISRLLTILMETSRSGFNEVTFLFT